MVDRSHVLRMPEYEAHLLGTEITPMRVTNASENEDLYPNGNGQLVSVQVMITNTSGKPLLFGSGVGYQPAPSYPRHPVLELALHTSPASSEVFDFPAMLNGRRAPTPSVFQQRPIAAHGHLVGWASFVAPSWSLGVISRKGADINFLRSDGSSRYIGQIRLWK